MAGLVSPRLVVPLYRTALELHEAELCDVCAAFVLGNAAAVVTVEPVPPAVSGPLLDIIARGLV